MTLPKNGPKAPAPDDTLRASDNGTRTPRGLGDIVISGVLLCLFGLAFVMSLEWLEDRSIFPTSVASVGVILSCARLLRGIFRNFNTRKGAVAENRQGEEDDDPNTVLLTATRVDWFIALAFIAGLFLVMYLFGIYIAGALFSLCYLRSQARQSWIGCVVYSSVVVILLYVIFGLLLQLPVPSGIVEW